MEKRALIVYSVLLAILSSLYLVSALELTASDSYSPGQTLIAEFKGNFLNSIKHNDVSFTYDRKIIALDYDILKMGDKYYLYANLPLEERNYTIKISNVHFYEQGQEKWINFTQNFSISGPTAPFAVNPGALITNSDIPLSLRNLGDNIVISVKLGTFKQTYNLGYAKVQDIVIPISSVSQAGMYNISVSSSDLDYSIPTLIVKESSNLTDNSIISNQTPQFRLGPNEISMEILKGVSTYLNLTIENLGDSPINLIQFSYSKDISSIVDTSPSIVENLGPYSVRNIQILISAPDRRDDFEGILTAFSDNYSDSTKFYINVVNELNSSTADNVSSSSLNSCVAVGGILCFTDEVCQGNYTNSIEGLCCLGRCIARSDISSSGGSTKLIIIILIVLVLGVIYWLYRRYRLNIKTPEKKIGELTKKFDSEFKS